MQETPHPSSVASLGETTPPPRQPEIKAELRQVLIIAGPLAVSFAAEMIMFMTHMKFVGYIDGIAIGAIGLASHAYFGLVMAAVAIASICNVRAAEAYARQDSEDLAGSLRQGYWVSAMLALILIVVGLHLADLLALTGQPPEAIPYMKDYLLGLVWCGLPYLWFTVLRGFVSTIGRTGSVMIITGIGIGLNFLLDYMFVLGHWGVPAFGAFGAGLVTSIVNWAMVIAMALYVHRHQKLRNYRIFQNLLNFDFKVVKEILWIGIPGAGVVLLEAGVFNAIGIAAGTFGDIYLTANQLAMNVIIILFMVPFAIAHAVMVRVAYGVGLKSQAAVRRSCLIGSGIGAVYMGISGLVLLFWGGRIAGLFLKPDDPDFTELTILASELLALAAIFQIADGQQAIFMHALRGLKDTRVPFLLGVCGYWLIGFLPGIVLATYFELKAVGLWIGLACGLSVVAFLLARRFFWRLRLVVDHQSEHAPTRVQATSIETAALS